MKMRIGYNSYKCAIKLYKWDRPLEWSFEGCSVKDVLNEVTPRSVMNAIAFPSREAEKDVLDPNLASDPFFYVKGENS